MKETVKVSFELNKEGKAEVQIVGTGLGIRSGLMTIFEKLAEIEEVEITELIEEFLNVAYMREKHPIEGILGGLFEVMFGDSDEEECDGNCDECEEMPQELKDALAMIFGGNEDESN